MASQDADLSLTKIDQYLIDKAFLQENNAHRARYSIESAAGLTKSKKTLVQAGPSNSNCLLYTSPSPRDRG